MELLNPEGQFGVAPAITGQSAHDFGENHPLSYSLKRSDGKLALDYLKC